MSNVLVLGGTGFLGSALIPKLKEAGHKVTVVVRKESDQKKVVQLKKQGCKVAHGDILDEGSIVKAAKNQEVIINLVGIIKETFATFEEVHHKGTLNALHAAKQNQVKHFIYISALGTDSDANNQYHQTKWLAEEAVKASDINYTIFRPSLLVGKNDEFFNKLLQMLKVSFFFPVFGSGRYKLQPIWVEDVADYIVQSITLEKAKNSLFEIGGPKQYTYNQILALLSSKLKKERSVIHIPLFLTWPIVLGMNKLLSDPPISVDQLKMLLKGNVVKNPKAKQVFNVKCRNIEKIIKEELPNQ